MGEAATNTSYRRPGKDTEVGKTSGSNLPSRVMSDREAEEHDRFWGHKRKGKK